MMRQIYNLVLQLMIPYVLVRLLWRGLRNHDYWRRWPERFGLVVPSGTPGAIWVHAVSVGEVRAAVPLIKALMASYPHHAIHVTTMTPTGSVQVRELFGNSVSHTYVPYDLPWAVRRFLNAVQPALALVMETELWPNLFRQCRIHGIPLMVANVRMSESSMNGYLRFAGLTRATLSCVSRFAVQSAADGERIQRMGANPARVELTGSIKFELSVPGSLLESAEVLRRQWGAARPVWVAASTHEGEDEPLLKAHRELLTTHPDLLLVLVPRHPERFASVTRLAQKHGFEVATRSETQGELPEQTQVLIGDTMGELLLFLAASDVCFMGGSLVPVGGHNLIEPAAVGIPVAFGPHMFNFQEISQMIATRGGGVQVRWASELPGVIRGWLDHPNARHDAGQAGRQMIEENRGALDKSLELIGQLLPND